MIQNFILSFFTVDGLCSLIAKAIANILEYASLKGGDAWDKAFNIVKQINTWTSLFVEVYEDEKLTPEEEQKIAEAIKNKTPINKIENILTK